MDGRRASRGAIGALLAALAWTGSRPAPAPCAWGACPPQVAAAREPGPPVAPDARRDDEERFVVIRAGRIVPVVGEDIRDGVIVIVNGRIRALGRDLDYPRNAQLIEARDLTVMPGLISPVTRVGLPTYNRTGVHGDLDVAAEYYPDATIDRELLDAGYTLIALVPDGRGVTGRATVVRPTGDRGARAVVAQSYVWITNDKKTFKAGLRKAQEEIERVEKARKEFEEKQRQAGGAAGRAPESRPSPPAATQPASGPATQPVTQPAFEPPKIDPAHQVLVDLIQKKEGLFALIELRQASDYVQMLDAMQGRDLAHRFVLRNFIQTDFEYVLDRFAEARPQVVVLPYLNYVLYSAERIHLVRALTQAGCEVSVAPLFDSTREHRVIRQRVADLVRDGWPRDAALKSLTLHPARLLGLSERFGSIEKDKEADLIFLDGDPLDPDARVRRVMIAGRIVHTADGDAE